MHAHAHTDAQISDRDGLQLYKESAQQIFKKYETGHRSNISHVTLDKEINAAQPARLSHCDCIYAHTVCQVH